MTVTTSPHAPVETSSKRLFRLLVEEHLARLVQHDSLLLALLVQDYLLHRRNVKLAVLVGGTQLRVRVAVLTIGKQVRVSTEIVTFF